MLKTCRHLTIAWIIAYLLLQVVRWHIIWPCPLTCGRGPKFSAAAVAATAEAAAAITSSQDPTQQKKTLEGNQALKGHSSQFTVHAQNEHKPHSHLGPPGRQHEVCVDIVFPKLLGHVQPQGSVWIVDVPLGEVGQHRVSIVQLLELVRCLWVLRVLVWMVPQRQLPDTRDRRFSAHNSFIHLNQSKIFCENCGSAKKGFRL